MDLGGQGQGPGRLRGLGAAAAVGTVLIVAVAGWLLSTSYSAHGGEIDCGTPLVGLSELEDDETRHDERDACFPEGTIRVFLALFLGFGALGSGVIGYRLLRHGTVSDAAGGGSRIVRPRPVVRWLPLLGPVEIVPLVALGVFPWGAGVIMLVQCGVWAFLTAQMVVVVRAGTLYRRGPFRWYRTPLLIDQLTVNEVNWGPAREGLDRDALTRRLELVDRTGTEYVFDAFVWNPAHLRAAIASGRADRAAV